MNKMSKVEEFKAGKQLLYVDAKDVLAKKYNLDNPHIMELEEEDEDEDGEEKRVVYTHEARENAMYAELAEVVQDKRALLEDLRKLEPVAALEECREAVALAEEIAGGVEVEAVFEVKLDYVKVENVKPAYAAEADKLAEQCKPFLSAMDEKLEALTSRIEAAREKAQDDPSKLEKVEELKKLREVAIIEGRETAGIDKQIIDLQEEIEANKKAAALAEEEAEILTRHADKVKERREAVASILAHIKALSCAFRAFLVADKCNRKAQELADLAGELAELKKEGVKAGAGVRFPEAVLYQYQFDVPRLEGSKSCIDDKGRVNSDPKYGVGSWNTVYIARIGRV